MEKEELYNEAWRLWGGDTQLDILIEEMAELTQAIIKTRRHNMTWSYAVLEEIADVSICLEQVETRLKGRSCDINRKTMLPTRYLFDIVEEIKERKLTRLEERICAEKGELQKR
jgi:hypothetical protein